MDKNIFDSLQLKTTKLTKDDLQSIKEKEGWTNEVFLGRAGGHFQIDLPNGYEFKNETGARGTDYYFDINNKQLRIRIWGEKFKFSQDSYDLIKFKSLVNKNIDESIYTFKNLGMEILGKSLKLQGIESENSWWCRATFSYKIDSKYYFNDLNNFFVKTIARIFDPHTRHLPYQEYKVKDFFYPEVGSEYQFFILMYTFDEVTTTDITSVMKIINRISSSFRYYDESQSN